MEEEEVDMEDSHMALIQEIISIKEVSSPVIKNISSSHPVSVWWTYPWLKSKKNYKEKYKTNNMEFNSNKKIM